MGECQFSEEEESTCTFNKCYGTEVDIMQVIDCALMVAGILENISGTFGEDAYAHGNDDEYSRPEEGHEDRATAVSEDAD
jgi:hypothetical protein